MAIQCAELGGVTLEGAKERIARSFQRRFCHPDLVFVGVSLLTDQEVSTMDQDDLRDVIRTAQSAEPHCEILDLVCQHSRSDLEEALRVIRRCLRYQVNAKGEEFGFARYFRDAW